MNQLGDKFFDSRLEQGTSLFPPLFFFHEFIVPRKSLSKISDRSPCKFSQREGIFKKRAKLKWRVVELVNCKSALRSNLRLAQIYFNFATFKSSSKIQVSKRFYFGFHTLQWHFSKEFDAAVFSDRITKLRIKNIALKSTESDFLLDSSVTKKKIWKKLSQYSDQS